MKVSRNWLARYVDLSGLSGREIAQELTLSTAEVERVEPFGAGLEPLLVGCVVERRRHPGADRLSLCSVDVGSGANLAIVCGAANVAAGQKVAVAPPGSTLPGGTRIEKAVIRGETSMGMICSEREMGLSDEHEGILVLPAAARTGARVVDAVPVADEVLEFDNKSINHRPDLWGHYGIARELAAIYGRELRPFHVPPELPKFGDVVPITIAAPERCPRYVGIVIHGIATAPAPAWLRWLLAAVGQRPISNIVDLTNFLMLDLGQPLHAFDLARLAGPSIDVRRARAREPLRTLDGTDRVLTAEDLVIADAEGPVAIAGVMGGSRSEVGPQTKSILLESASFEPTGVRQTSARLGLRTESSSRFEKSLDPEHAWLAMEKFVAMLDELAPGAKAAGPAVDAGGWRFPGRVVILRKERLAAKLGIRLPDAKVGSILRSLQFTVEDVADAFRVSVPSFRATKDVAIEDDLVEEVGRMHRYDHIPERAPLQPMVMPWRDPELQLLRRVREVCAAGLGFHEAYNYSFLHDGIIAALTLDPESFCRVQNPVDVHWSRIRRDVVPSLLGDLEVNLRRDAEVRLFEAGKGYRPETRDALGLPFEVHQVGFVIARKHAPPDPLAEVRGALDLLLRRLGRSPSFRGFGGAGEGTQSERPGWLHPGRCLAVLAGTSAVGHAGDLHPQAASRLGIKAACAVATLDLRALLAAPEDVPRYVPPPKFPSQPVDVALFVPVAARVAAIADFLRDLDPALVASVRLFEVYRGKGVPEGRKSVNFTVTLASGERTLTTEDQDRFLAKLRDSVAKIDAELRAGTGSGPKS